jgi:hypothetical protein
MIFCFLINSRLQLYLSSKIGSKNKHLKNQVQYTNNHLLGTHEEGLQVRLPRLGEGPDGPAERIQNIGPLLVVCHASGRVLHVEGLLNKDLESSSVRSQLGPVMA